VRAFVYVDGFNLYHRALRRRVRNGDGEWERVKQLRWLDLKALAQRLLPDDTIERVKYFTAHISGRRDADAPRRQRIYLNALSCVPEMSIYFGTFKERRKRRPLVTPIPGHAPVQEFFDTEEKGSDVNLAAHLVYDGCTNAYEVAAVISNDTDLIEPIRIVAHQLGKSVILLSPCKPHEELVAVASAKRQIHRRDIRESQFPDTMEYRDKLVHKPLGW
jgi:hypothetical protein